MKTSELTGPALDWAVCLAEGGCPVINPHRFGRIDYGYFESELGYRIKNYSTDWAQGGPIIGRECIDLYCDHAGVSWRARKMLGERGPMAYGPTPLIAAMRCYVASKLGDEIEIPAELQP